MRLADRPIPTFVPHVGGPGWLADIHLIMETPAGDLLWDSPTATWDQPDPVLAWDEPYPGGYADLTCDLAGVDIAHGQPDVHRFFPAGQMLATLIDPDGRYTRYRPDGTLDNAQLSRHIGIVADFDGEWWWLYWGRVVAWQQVDDDTIEVEAYNCPNDLTRTGLTYTPGVNGQKPGARLPTICALAPVVVDQRFATGFRTLTAQPTQRSLYEECQAVALSDGGMIFADADDFLMYLTHAPIPEITPGMLFGGRTDQTRLDVFTDNACEYPDVVVAWSPVLSTNDEEFAATVTVTNIAGLIGTDTLPSAVEGENTIYTHPTVDQWTTQAEGDGLAEGELYVRGQLTAQPREFQLWITDDRHDLWRIGADTRLGDRTWFAHNYRNDGPQQFVVQCIVHTVRHSITPSEWIVTLGQWSYPLLRANEAHTGEPGTWTTTDDYPAPPPYNFDQLVTADPGPPITPIPLTPWPPGDYVVLGDGSEVSWDGDSWELGRRATPIPAYWQGDRWQQGQWSSGALWDFDAWDIGRWDL